MTDTTLPGDESADRVEPVDIQQEMQRSYIDYAMSVIVGRALPEVRDGLKPVHRRVLYAMFDSGFRPGPQPREVGALGGRDDGQLSPARRRVDLRHPGADGPAVVAALPAGRRPGQLRLAGQRPASRHALLPSGDALVRLPFGQSMRIGGVVRNARPNSDNAIDLKVLDRHGNPVVAEQLFHSGEHQTYTVRTAEGYQVTGTANHPLLCLVDVGGVPTLLWKLIEEIRPDDYVVLQRTPPVEFGPAGVARHAGSAAAGGVHQRGVRLRNPSRLREPGP